jgi:hypothetical protein
MNKKKELKKMQLTLDGYLDSLAMFYKKGFRQGMDIGIDDNSLSDSEIDEMLNNAIDKAKQNTKEIFLNNNKID